MLTGETFDVWVGSLESGRYKQGRSHLLVRKSPEYSGMFCCMGVLCDVIGVDLDAMFVTEMNGQQLRCPIGDLGGVADDDAPDELREALDYATRSRLAGMNDSGKSFQEIAAWLREHRDEIVTAV